MQLNIIYFFYYYKVRFHFFFIVLEMTFTYQHIIIVSEVDIVYNILHNKLSTKNIKILHDCHYN